MKIQSVERFKGGVIDRLKVKGVLDPTLPAFHIDYYDMLDILENNCGERILHIHEAYDMLRGYVDCMLCRYHTSLPLILYIGIW